MSTRRQRGIALIAVLWVLLLLAFLAASFSSSTRTEANLARNLVENAKAEALADAGSIRESAGLAILPSRKGGCELTEPSTPGRSETARCGSRSMTKEGRSTSTGLRWISFTACSVVVGLDEQEAAALADAIVDFRDDDNDRRPQGAEDPDYQAAGLPNQAKDAPFELVEELLQVKGVTGELYLRLRPSLTVYTGEDIPDSSTAPPEVLAALSAILPEDLEQDTAQEEEEGVEQREERAGRHPPRRRSRPRYRSSRKAVPMRAPNSASTPSIARGDPPAARFPGVTPSSASAKATIPLPVSCLEPGAPRAFPLETPPEE